jgi:hypothetical protein
VVSRVNAFPPSLTRSDSTPLETAQKALHFNQRVRRRASSWANMEMFQFTRSILFEIRVDLSRTASLRMRRTLVAVVIS